MTLFLLDTDCAVYGMLGLHPELRKRLADRAPGEIVISAITLAEIFLGEKQGKPPDMKVIDDFLSVIPVVPFDEAAARAYAELPFRRGSFDRLIAAHALSVGATVVTNNESDFADLPQLKVENWTRP